MCVLWDIFGVFWRLWTYLDNRYNEPFLLNQVLASTPPPTFYAEARKEFSLRWSVGYILFIIPFYGNQMRDNILYNDVRKKKSSFC